MKIWLAVLLAFLTLATPASAAGSERTVVVVLFDGFAPAELDATRGTPNFDRLKREGAWSRHLVPAFPTISLINHTTFATGCWPEHHGIVSNVFYDPKRGLFANGRHEDDADWRTGCETMWEAAEHQGARSAVFNWIDRWSTRRGRLASFVNPEVPWKQREDDETIVNRAVALLHETKADHPRLIALYFNIPDDVAHYDGVSGARTQEAVRRCDAIVGRLMAAIRSMPQGREGTLVVGTDHGMMDVGPVINLGRLMNEYDIHARQASDGATAFLYLDKGESAARVQRALSAYSYAFKIYTKGHYPPFAHLGSGPRSGDLMLVANPPYWVVGPEVMPWWANALGVNRIWPAIFTPFMGGLKATHGYDPAIVQMHGIFYAWGAGVIPHEIQRLDMIDIHPTVMTLLGLQAGHPIDGKALKLGD
ncbi:MAG: alkaline phosphatase family protein [Alphaproteobacteria bacterium]|nr:alkaline phosphatase family protein [Alphaproteobacteria bacterium]MBV9692185.1 alkaline phosphatase family protein [Alphaproteobacteria bacterium]